MLHDPGLMQPEPLSMQQATADLCLSRRHSDIQRQVLSVSVGLLRPGAHKVLFEPSKCLWKAWGLILNVILPLLPFYWGISFALRCGVSVFGGIQHSPVNGCFAVSCSFGVLTGEDDHMSFYSTIFPLVSYYKMLSLVACAIQ